ncbi:DinB family protein [Edaphobacter albus]|uniref:DinB family protein n=1 Tax=Edaphobacter sp. 4G125 TaxID=2763071 RepID=UPI001644171D|nr:DinB family protein [Edaphobacter sp. 4G125]QNI36779.1 DinB family protein [Edaphobacter sp. 4G125]
MGVTYTQGTDPELLNPVELSQHLSATLRNSVAWLATLSNADASVSEREGKWCAKEILGHLTDSAVNNLGRIVRMQIAFEEMPGYAQDSWVQLQDYREREWAEVLALWFALNEHLVWTIGHINPHNLSNPGVVAGTPLTLGFLIEDYIAHMEHHLTALKAWIHPGEN